MDKDYEGLVFFQPVPSQTGRFKNGPDWPETNTTNKKTMNSNLKYFSKMFQYYY